ncbi:pro-opiomelanocortin [Talpa occidentalis]|uniref:pro-opiomelanocortin n=1 Tax=Talpa occidentalis TaxID=50954 RepID=UPI00188FDDAD|nr:pro-opiomelanocortin [Talpa occidentalis]XP_037382823.1 pro-opiomelanocortin [Talpa occidentalis]
MLRSCCSRSGALLLVLLLQASMEVRGWCLENNECQDLTMESNLLACLQACQRELRASMLVSPGDEHLLTDDRQKYDAGQQHVEEVGANIGLLGPQGEGTEPGQAGHLTGKRSYSMEHFRWGKPVGKKRRPVKVYPNGSEDRLPAALPVEFKRALADERPDGLAESVEDLEDGPEGDTQKAEKKNNGRYKMEHFRWGRPPKSKRHEGFMTEKMQSLDQVYLDGTDDETGEGPEGLEESVADLEDGLVGDTQEADKKKKGRYKMEHFRWGRPPKSKSKRYGGFMTEKSQTPLMTLFKNAIIKNTQEKGQ